MAHTLPPNLSCPKSWTALQKGTSLKPRRFLSKELNLPWVIPVSGQVAYNLERFESTFSNRFQLAQGYLTTYIADIVYPYWCYNVERHGPGSVCIEICDSSPINSVIGLSDLRIVKNPMTVSLTFLNVKQIQTFSDAFCKKLEDPDDVDCFLETTLSAYKSRQDKIERGKGGGMSMIITDKKESSAMIGWPGKRNKSYEFGCSLFAKALDNAGMKKCHSLHLGLRNKSVICYDFTKKICAWLHCKNDSTKLKMCSGCRQARYCCRSHQKRHWKPQHRFKCKKIK